MAEIEWSVPIAEQNTEVLKKIISLEEAKEIIGDDKFVGIEAAQILELKGKYRLEDYKEIPFTGTELQDAREKGMYLVAMPKINLLGLCRMESLNGRSIFVSEHYWHNAAPFAKTYARPGFHLMGILPSSGFKDMEEQMKGLPEGFGLPTAVELAYLFYTNLVLGIKRDERLENWVRTNTATSFTKDFADHDKVILRTKGDRIQIDHCLESNHISNILLATNLFKGGNK